MQREEEERERETFLRYKMLTCGTADGVTLLFNTAGAGRTVELML